MRIPSPRVVALLTAVALAPALGRAEESWPYRRDEPLPPGFHVEKRANKALIITGGAVFGAGVFVLVAGIATASRKRDSTVCPDHDCSNTSANSLMAGGAALLGIGVVLTLVGIATPRLVVLRGDPPKAKPAEPDVPDKEPVAPKLMLAPATFGTAAGISLRGAF